MIPSGELRGPRRRVVGAVDDECTTGQFGNGPRRIKRWWDLTLECGHVVERPAKYAPASGRRGGARSGGDRIPAPASVWCRECLAEGRA